MLTVKACAERLILAGVSISALALVSSLLVFFAVSWLTRDSAALSIDPDIHIVMNA